MTPRDLILQDYAHKPLPTEPIHAFGSDLVIKTMTAAEKDAFDAEYIEHKEAGSPNLRALLLIHTLCNPDLTPVFQPKDLDAVGSIALSHIEPVFDVALKLNKIDGDEAAELAGNS